MKAHEIAQLAIPSICEKNCVLFMWVTMPLILDSKRRKPSWKPTKTWPKPHDMQTVLEGWGFEYATCGFTWVKTTKDWYKFKYGPGSYTASNTELCIIAVKGKGMMPRDNGGQSLLPSVIRCPRMEHSKKPDIHEDIDKMYPSLSKIELFARRRYPGWDAMGHGIDGKSLEETIGLQCPF